MNETREKTYAARFDKIIDDIEVPLGDELRIEHLSQIANFSNRYLR